MVKKLILNATLSFFSIFLFFGLLEFGSRFYYAFKNKPTNDYEVFLNEQGISSSDKRSDEKRIFVLGESAVRGVPYSLNFSMTGFLQKLMDQSDHSNFRVINAGVPGKHSFWQRDLSGSLAHYGADIVILYAGNNDTRDFSNVLRDLPFAKYDFELAQKSVFYNGLKRKFLAIKKLVNEKAGKALFNANENPDDAMHWTDAYLRKKKEYLENPDKGIARKMKAIRDYHDNLNHLVHELREKGITVIVASLPIVHQSEPGISDWSRKGYTFEQKIIFDNPQDEKKWNDFYKTGASLLSTGKFEDAISNFSSALKINSSYPMLFHLIGEAYLALGNAEQAKIFFIKGKDAQIQSPGGDSFKNNALREIAAENHAFWIDTQKPLEESSPNGVVGKNLFLDHCHPNVVGHKIIAASMMSSLCEHSIVTCNKNFHWQQGFELLSSGPPDKTNIAREYLLTGFYLFKGTQWDPNPDYKSAIEYFNMALEIMPENKDIYALLAPSYLKIGNLEKSKQALRRLKDIDDADYQKILREFPELSKLAI